MSQQSAALVLEHLEEAMQQGLQQRPAGPQDLRDNCCWYHETGGDPAVSCAQQLAGLRELIEAEREAAAEAQSAPPGATP